MSEKMGSTSNKIIFEVTEALCGQNKRIKKSHKHFLPQRLPNLTGMILKRDLPTYLGFHASKPK